MLGKVWQLAWIYYSFTWRKMSRTFFYWPAQLYFMLFEWTRKKKTTCKSSTSLSFRKDQELQERRVGESEQIFAIVANYSELFLIFHDFREFFPDFSRHPHEHSIFCTFTILSFARIWSTESPWGRYYFSCNNWNGCSTRVKSGFVFSTWARIK